MITINITDSFGNEIQIDDVVICHYTNKKVKFFGLLRFKKENCTFILTDGDDDYESIDFKSSYKKYERLCRIADVPELKKELGRIEVQQEKEFKKIFDLVNKINHHANPFHQYYQ